MPVLGRLAAMYHLCWVSKTNVQPRCNIRRILYQGVRRGALLLLVCRIFTARYAYDTEDS